MRATGKNRCLRHAACGAMARPRAGGPSLGGARSVGYAEDAMLLTGLPKKPIPNALTGFYRNRSECMKFGGRALGPHRPAATVRTGRAGRALGGVSACPRAQRGTSESRAADTAPQRRCRPQVLWARMMPAARDSDGPAEPRARAWGAQWP